MVKVYEVGEVYSDGKTPVPSYDELQSYEKCVDMLFDVNKKWERTIKERKRLEKKLDIATKTLKDLELANDIRICMKAQEALTKMEGVK